ncbi:MAG: translation initiation factor [Anaerolineales bacterium]|nr:translation initiation factor [Anaerolineales bacterium]
MWSSSEGDLRKKDSRQSRRVISLPPGKQTAYLHRDSKGRGGKVVTVIRRLVLSEQDMIALARQLKQACGTGGAVKEGAIEIQGEQREKIAAVLESLGYKVKIAGG